MSILLHKHEPWITTVSGIQFHFLDPQPDEIDIKDIAFSLSNQCRFNGHIPFYSVAEHSIMVAKMLPKTKQLAGLLHDASEAYLADIPSPVKHYLPEYKSLENNLLTAIGKKFDVDLFDPEIKYADTDALYTEARYLLKDGGSSWVPSVFVANNQYKPYLMPPAQAFQAFMSVFTELTKPNIIMP